jgi:hypothetical protein
MESQIWGLGKFCAVMGGLLRGRRRKGGFDFGVHIVSTSLCRYRSVSG